MAKKSDKQKLYEAMSYVNPDFITRNTKKTIIKEWDNYNYPAGADADPNAPWNQNDPDFDSIDIEMNPDPGLVNISINDTHGGSVFSSLQEILEYYAEDQLDQKFAQLLQGDPQIAEKEVEELAFKWEEDTQPEYDYSNVHDPRADAEDHYDRQRDDQRMGEY